MNDSVDSLLGETIGQDVKSFYISCKQLQRDANKLMKLVEADDISDVLKVVAQLKRNSASINPVLSSIADKAEEFDFKGICEEGDYPSMFESACKEYNLEIVGRFPSYEIFPIKVEFMIEDLCVEINGKKYRELHSRYLAETIKKERDKLINAPFNAREFCHILERYYNLLKTQIIQERKLENDVISVSLKSIYGLFTPLPAMRRTYTINMFAFDIYRLLDAQDKGIITKYRIELGSARNIRSAIRIVGQNGHSDYYGSLRFIVKGDEI